MLALRKLKRGDIVQNIGSGNSYVVTDTYLDFAVVVMTRTLTNPDEWILFNPKESDEGRNGAIIKGE